MTNAELKAIEARAAAATEGPWVDGVCPDQSEQFLAAEVRAPGREIVFYTEGCFSEAQDKANARLAAHSRTDIPALCMDVWRLRHSCTLLATRLQEFRLAEEAGFAPEPPVVHVRDEMVEQPSLLSTDVKDNK